MGVNRLSFPKPETVSAPVNEREHVHVLFDAHQDICGFLLPLWLGAFSDLLIYKWSPKYNPWEEKRSHTFSLSLSPSLALSLHLSRSLALSLSPSLSPSLALSLSLSISLSWMLQQQYFESIETQQIHMEDNNNMTEITVCVCVCWSLTVSGCGMMGHVVQQGGLCFLLLRLSTSLSLSLFLSLSHPPFPLPSYTPWSNTVLVLPN